MNLSNINQENVFVKSVIGNVRTKQEDHCGMAETPNGDVFVVCDGVGGNVGGAMAASIAVEAITEFLANDKYDNVPQAINDAIQYANQRILSYASANHGFDGMATTVCVLLLQENNAFIAHVGDSRIYLYLGREKKLHRITKDHSYVQTLVDAGEITDEEAEMHPRKNVILKALGIDREVDPTIDMLQPKNEDVFLICTDGLNGMISDKTIENIMKLDTPLELKGEKLVDLAMQGEDGRPGGLDNCTLQLIKIDNSPWNKSEFVSYNPKSHDDKQLLSEPESEKPDPDVVTDKSKSRFSIEKMLYIIIPLLIIMSCIIFANRDKDEKESTTAEVKTDDVVTREDTTSCDNVSVEPEPIHVPESKPADVPEQNIVVEQNTQSKPESEVKPELKTPSKPSTIYTKNVSFGITKVVDAGNEYKISYKVRKGDNVSEICQLFDCSRNDFRKWNNLKNDNIGAGMVYLIKKDKASVECKIHTVKKNEILVNIAKRNKVKMDDVIVCNGLKNPNSIAPGQKLILIVK